MSIFNHADVEQLSSDMAEFSGKLENVVELLSQIDSENQDNSLIIREDSEKLSTLVRDGNLEVLSELPSVIKSFSQLESRLDGTNRKIEAIVGNFISSNVGEREKDINIEIINFKDIVTELKFLADNGLSHIMKNLISPSVVEKIESAFDKEDELDAIISKLMIVTDSLVNKTDKLKYIEPIILKSIGTMNEKVEDTLVIEAIDDATSEDIKNIEKSISSSTLIDKSEYMVLVAGVKKNSFYLKMILVVVCFIGISLIFILLNTAL